MSHLAGWVDPEGVRDPAAVIAAMVTGLAANWQGDGSPPTGLATAGDPAETSFHRDNTGWAAIVGSPRWSAPRLAALARERGHAQALKAAHADHGEALFDHLWGTFALAVVDARSGRGILAIDRVGVGRLCYARPKPGTVVFSSSADAIVRHPGVHTSVDPQALHDFLFFFAVPCPTTIYREVRKLQPAQFLRLGERNAEPAFYWSMPYRPETPEPRAALEAELHTVLDQSTRRAIDGERTDDIGCFLSGGLDSSSVVGLLGRNGGGSVRAFTIGFAEPRYDETPYARAAAEHFGARHEIYTLTAADAAGFLPTLATAYDEPFANTSAIPTYFCAKLARERGVALMLAGDGGDEIFAGNARYVEMLRLERYQSLPAWLRRGVVEPLATITAAADPTGIGRRVRRRVRHLATPLPHRMLERSDPDAANAMFAGDFLAAVDPRGPHAIMGEVYGRATSDQPLHRMMHHDLQLTLADNDLRKVGRMCELAGVRVHYPMLDDDVVAFSARLSTVTHLGGLKLRDFYRRAMVGFLPGAILAKKKHGFGMPGAVWFDTSNAYRDVCLDGFRDFMRRGVLDPAFAAATLDACIKPPIGGSRPLGTVVDVAVLEHWLQSRGH